MIKNLKIVSPVLLVVLIFFHLLFLLNTRYTVWPEMVLYPYLMLNDFSLYKDIINPYFPLLNTVLWMYFKIFGLSIWNLKVFTYSWILITDLIIFWTAYKLSKDYCKSLIAVGVFLLLQISFGGNSLWFELFLTPFIILITVLSLFATSKKQTLIIGLLLAISVLTKQNAVLFFIPVTYLFIKKGNFKYIPLLFLPGLLLAGLTFFSLYSQGILNDFLQWSVILTLTYSSAPGFVSMPAIRQYLYILLPTLPYILNFFQLKNRIYWGGMSLVSLVFAFPRYENFHLQVAAGIGAILSIFLPRKIFLIFIILIIVMFIKDGLKYWQQEDRFLDQGVYTLSEKIKDYQSVYLLNSPELAYFLSNKLPPKPWATNFPWYFENTKIDESIINYLDKQSVRYIIVGDRIGGDKYALGNYLPEKLMTYVYDKYQYKERFLEYTIYERR